jgi:hypothetical protein
MSTLAIWISAWVIISILISRKTKSIVTIIGGGFLVSLAVIIIYSLAEGPLVNSEPHDPCQIAKAFADDEMSAIAQYEGKRLIIKGVAGVKGSGFGDLWLQFPCGKSWPAVQCFFKKSKASDLAQISSGQTVSIKGECIGKTFGTLMFKNCSILKN